ncbi:MAG: malto-oligosyltrehalose trehalohydrolase [Desulfuromonadales bacterium]
MRIGAYYLGDNRCRFTVWAPQEERLQLHLLTPAARLLPMERREDGYWHLLADDVPPGALYVYRLESKGRERPDPASFFQPQGLHKPSAVVDHRSFPWQDGQWPGLALEEFVIYELHVGAFTPQGTFDAVIPRLAELRELGITAIEIMPVSQFPGTRGWGYDGVHPFAVQNSYGGPEGLKRLVDACHRHGLAAILDVVYNHLGPEGNYLREFGPYFTANYHTPWGEAVNMDAAGSDAVRRYFIENALFWLREYHFDALRLDATDRIYDFSAKPFLQELAEQVRAYRVESGRRCLLMAENDHNDARLIRPPEAGGFGLDAHWNDDFHHSLHTLFTAEDVGYYVDFGQASDLAKAYREGYAYDWRHSKFRGHRRGSSAADRPGRQFVVCAQNHDQIGNRMFGQRLLTLAGFEAAKTAAAAVILSPYLPLFFMGEEYAEEAPFLFFADFLDEGLRAAVHRGRIEEFAAFKWRGEPPDPHDPETFQRSILNWETRHKGRHRAMLLWYKTLLQLRRDHPALGAGAARDAGALEAEKAVWLRRWHDGSQLLLLLSFNAAAATLSFPAAGNWRKILDSADGAWDGPGATVPAAAANGDSLPFPAFGCALFQQE